MEAWRQKVEVASNEEWYIPRVSLHFHRCRNINFDSSLLFCPYNSRTNT